MGRQRVQLQTVSSGWRLEMLLNILWCTEQLPTVEKWSNPKCEWCQDREPLLRARAHPKDTALSASVPSVPLACHPHSQSSTSRLSGNDSQSCISKSGTTLESLPSFPTAWWISTGWATSIFSLMHSNQTCAYCRRILYFHYGNRHLTTHCGGTIWHYLYLIFPPSL